MPLICCDRMKLRNLKASFVFKQPIKTSKKVLNSIIRHAPFTFTIYHHSPCLVNVTGVKSLNQLTLAQETIERKLQQQVDKIRIDNAFYSQKNFANVDLRQVYAFMKKSDTFSEGCQVPPLGRPTLEPGSKNFFVYENQNGHCFWPKYWCPFVHIWH